MDTIFVKNVKEGSSAQLSGLTKGLYLIFCICLCNVLFYFILFFILSNWFIVGEDSFYNEMKKGMFTDTSLFHFLAYRINRLTLNHRRQTLPQERRIVAIDVNTYTPKTKQTSQMTSEFFSVERLTNEFFHRFLIPFVHVVSKLDLFKNAS